MERNERRRKKETIIFMSALCVCMRALKNTHPENESSKKEEKISSLFPVSNSLRQEDGEGKNK